MSHDDIALIRRKRLLRLLGEIDDNEFPLLNAYGHTRGMGDSAAWQAVQRPEPATLGSSQEVLDQNQLFELGKNNLLWLGLLEEKEAAGGRGSVRMQIAYLGRMLLTEARIELPY